MELAGSVLLPYTKSGLADGSSFDLFELLQGAEVGWVWFPRVNLRPGRPGNFTDIDVATRVDCETVRRKELSEFGPCRRVAEAADQIAPVVYDTDARPEIGNITADGCCWADFADVADRSGIM